MALHPWKDTSSSQTEMLNPTFIWKAATLVSQVHTNISTRLPSIYRMWQALRLCLMMILLWGLSRWRSTAPNQLLISSSYLHISTCAVVLFVFLIPRSAPTLTFLCFFPTPTYCSIPCLSLFLFLFVSDQSRLPCCSSIRLLILRYDA